MTVNKGKGTACFYCRNSIRLTQSHEEARQTGWCYDCKLDIDNTLMNGEREKIMECPQAVPRWGFQIGGYYTHMWFEYDGTSPENGGLPDGCMEWHILSDGEFTREEDEEYIIFHICDFRQIERFIKVWGDELRRRGWVTDDDDGDS